jgi:hypothetical protein
MKTTHLLAIAFSATLLLATIPDADAASIRVRCEERSDRSKISVDGKDLTPGNYKARVISDSNRKTSPLQPTVGDEVEFDFDSNPDDVAAGATQIPSNFIQNATVAGKIINSEGFTVAIDTVTCKLK